MGEEEAQGEIGTAKPDWVGRHPFPDYYKQLGLRPNASEQQIDARIKAFHRELHESNYINSPPEIREEAMRGFQRVAEAKRVIGKPGRAKGWKETYNAELAQVYERIEAKVGAEQQQTESEQSARVYGSTPESGARTFSGAQPWSSPGETWRINEIDAEAVFKEGFAYEADRTLTEVDREAKKWLEKYGVKGCFVRLTLAIGIPSLALVTLHSIINAAYREEIVSYETSQTPASVVVSHEISPAPAPAANPTQEIVRAPELPDNPLTVTTYEAYGYNPTNVESMRDWLDTFGARPTAANDHLYFRYIQEGDVVIFFHLPEPDSDTPTIIDALIEARVDVPRVEDVEELPPEISIGWHSIGISDDKNHGIAITQVGIHGSGMDNRLPPEILEEIQINP